MLFEAKNYIANCVLAHLVIKVRANEYTGTYEAGKILTEKATGIFIATETVYLHFSRLRSRQELISEKFRSPRHSARRRGGGENSVIKLLRWGVFRIEYVP